MNYTAAPDFHHDQPGLTGVLLVNLGSPEAPTVGSVRRYLAQFLSDPRVVEAPRWLWLPILHGAILRVRPWRSSAAYRTIWKPDGSPLVIYTDALAREVERQLAPAATGARVEVRMAMRYGAPAIETQLQQWQAAGLRRLLVLPLYPQYSATTTATVFDVVFAELSRWRWVPEVRTVGDYFAEPAWLDAVAARVRAHRERHGAADRLLFSFHGIPDRYFRAGDPYFCQCQASARAIAERLQLAREAWAVSFQSRVGREPWLKPYTDETLAGWPAEGVRSVQVVCPGFAVDCLETIEEIDEENRERFLHAGGERFEYIPALNAEPDHAAVLATLLRRHLQGWAPQDATQDQRDAPEARAERERRHRDFQGPP